MEDLVLEFEGAQISHNAGPKNSFNAQTRCSAFLTEIIRKIGSVLSSKENVVFHAQILQ